MVFKYCKKGQDSWTYMSGNEFKVTHFSRETLEKFRIESLKKEQNSIQNKDSKLETFFGTLMNFLYCEKDMWAENYIYETDPNSLEEVEYFTVVSKSQDGIRVKAIVFDSRSYSGYLLNDEGKTIEKIVG